MNYAEKEAKEVEIRQSLEALMRAVCASARIDLLAPDEKPDLLNDSTLMFAFEVADLFSKLDELYCIVRGVNAGHNTQTFDDPDAVYAWLSDRGYRKHLLACPLIEIEFIYWMHATEAPVMTRRNYIVPHVELFGMVGGDAVFSEGEHGRRSSATG